MSFSETFIWVLTLLKQRHFLVDVIACDGHLCNLLRELYCDACLLVDWTFKGPAADRSGFATVMTFFAGVGVGNNIFCTKLFRFAVLESSFFF